MEKQEINFTWQNCSYYGSRCITIGLFFVINNVLFKVTERNNLLFKFLWDNKGDKLKWTEMIADYQDGGQKMLDIIEFNKALKIS